MNYESFIQRKSQIGGNAGFDPTFMPDCLFDFQKSLVEWAVRKGRAAIFADCGLGKTLMQLVWAENVVRRTNKPVLVLTPLAVGPQTVREAEKFGIEAKVSRDGTVHQNITVANYERLHYFNCDDFSGVVCDESSILKNADGKRKKLITEFLRLVPHRLLTTATAAPNDYWELGTSSEALGYLGFRDMLGKFFKEETEKDYLGWGRTKYRFRGHAEQQFWRWVCSWARVCRKPSDIGFSDESFTLPPLEEVEIIVRGETLRPGMLLPIPAKTLQDQREELRVTLKERTEKAAEIATSHDRPSVTWCHLNPEADALERLIPGSKQVSGSMSDEAKEETLVAFQTGELKRLILKPKLGCFGLNWQHCHDVTVFPSHSWEQYYQAIRRCLRFGQKHAVRANIIATEGQHGVMRSLQRKTEQASNLFASITKFANAAIYIDGGFKFTNQERIPTWL